MAADSAFRHFVAILLVPRTLGRAIKAANEIEFRCRTLGVVVVVTVDAASK